MSKAFYWAQPKQLASRKTGLSFRFLDIFVYLVFGLVRLVKICLTSHSVRIRNNDFQKNSFLKYERYRHSKSKLQYTINAPDQNIIIRSWEMKF